MGSLREQNGWKIGTREGGFSAISNIARPCRRVLTESATDAQSGRKGGFMALAFDGIYMYVYVCIWTHTYL